MKILQCIIYSLLLAVSSSGWTPPIGIPAPNWGPTIGNPIDYPRPEPPSSWNANVPLKYYVDYNASGSSNHGDDFTGTAHQGYPGSPRKTIPRTPPAGSVIYVNGLYPQDHSGNGQSLTYVGTDKAPIMVTSFNVLDRAKATWGWEFRAPSKFVIVTDFDFDFSQFAAVHKDFGIIAGAASTHHYCFRKGIYRGFGAQEGDHGNHTTMLQFSGYQSWDAVEGVNQGSVEDVVYSNLKATHASDWMWMPGGPGGDDPDGHVMGIGQFTRNIWVVDCEMGYTSGDAIQIGAGSTDSTLDVDVSRNIYIGRNRFHHCAQPALGIKRSDRVIISENTFYDMRRDNGAMNSGGIGTQYGNRNLWIIGNTFHTNQSGINMESALGSDSGPRTDTDTYIIGNLFYDIHDVANIQQDSTWRTQYLGAGACIKNRGSQTCFVINNTFDDYGIGIVSPAVGGCLNVHGNLFTNREATVGGDFISEGDINNDGRQSFSQNIIMPVVEHPGGAAVIYFDCGNLKSKITNIAGVNALKGPDNSAVALGTPIYQNQPARDYRLVAGFPGIDNFTKVVSVEGNLIAGKTYTWVKVASNLVIDGTPNFSNVGAGTAPYSIGTTFVASSSAAPTAWGGAIVSYVGEHPAYALFQATYGIDIRRDRSGGVRPFSGKWDIGAYEFGSVGAPEVPPTTPGLPSGLRVKPAK